MKKINVLLTKYSDWISQLVYYIGGFGYTHASISLEEDESTYYSFNYKGFAVESVEAHQHRGVKRSICYQLMVSDDAYASIRSEIDRFLLNKDSYSYTRLGLLFCILKIPFYWEKHYFCSQFVAELLTDAKAVPLKKQPCLYLPNHFRAEMENMPQLVRVMSNIV